MSSKVELSELPQGHTHIEVVSAILGVGTLLKKLIAANGHPRMRLITAVNATALITATGPSEDASFMLSLAHTTSGAVVDIVHKDGKVAGRGATTGAVFNIVPFVTVASADQKDNDIFEAEEEVLIKISTVAGNAADASLIVAKFEVVQ